jgi:hypothetical protein
LLTADQFEDLLLREPRVALATLKHVAVEVRRLSVHNRRCTEPTCARPSDPRSRRTGKGLSRCCRTRTADRPRLTSARLLDAERLSKPACAGSVSRSPTSFCESVKYLSSPARTERSALACRIMSTNTQLLSF